MQAFYKDLSTQGQIQHQVDPLSIQETWYSETVMPLLDEYP